MRALVASAAASALILLTGCPAKTPAICQTLATAPTDVAKDGYVLRFVRSAPASPGCETATPEEMSDVWVFNTVADSVVLAHSVSMPFPEGEPTPPGRGEWTVRPGRGRCERVLRRAESDNDERLQRRHAPLL